MTASPWDGTSGSEAWSRGGGRVAAASPDDEAFDRLLSVLVPGEEIGWTGRADRIAAAAGIAKTCLLLAATTAAMMAAVDLLGGWFTLLQFFALVPAVGTVVTLPVAAYELIAAGRTYYAVTCERVLVVRAWPRRSIEILMPAWIVEVRRKGGIGGRESLEIRQTDVTGVRMISNMFRESREGPVLTLYGIGEIEAAAAAIDRLRSWREPLVVPSLRPVNTVAGRSRPSVGGAALEDASDVDRSWEPAAGEQVVWTGRPSPWSVFMSGLRRALRLAAVAIGMVTIGLVVLVQSGRPEFLLMLAWLSLVPGIGAIGALIQAACDAASATGRRFVITDARVVVTDNWIRNRVRFLILSPDLSIEWKRRVGDRGTIVICAGRSRAGTISWDPMRRSRRKPLLSMHGVANVEAAAAALDRLLASVRPTSQ